MDLDSVFIFNYNIWIPQKKRIFTAGGKVIAARPNDATKYKTTEDTEKYCRIYFFISF